jgi:hypothetical protein
MGRWGSTLVLVGLTVIGGALVGPRPVAAQESGSEVIWNPLGLGLREEEFNSPQSLAQQPAATFASGSLPVGAAPLQAGTLGVPTSPDLAVTEGPAGESGDPIFIGQFPPIRFGGAR